MLAILVPVLNRPQNVKPLLDSIRENTPDPYRVLFIADPDDTAELAAIADEGGQMIAPGGGYAAKINAGCRATTEPLVALVADDVVFHPGWLDAARAKIAEGAHAVGLNDLRPRPQEAATHFVVTREYCERPTIDGGEGPMHAGYLHNFPDRELVETAQNRCVYAYAVDAIVEHRHHLDGHVPLDDTYVKGQATFRRDNKTFRRRAHLWER